MNELGGVWYFIVHIITSCLNSVHWKVTGLLRKFIRFAGIILQLSPKTCIVVLLTGLSVLIMAAQCCQHTAQSADLLSNLADGNLKFALNLYKEFGAKAGNGNVFFSPLSITVALSMTRAGARGNTLSELTQALQLENETEPDSGISDVLFSLNKAKDSFTLLTANKVYVQNSYMILPEFLEQLKENFGASVDGVDFVGRALETSREINQWVEKQTANKIRDLISAESLGQMTRLMLVNAVYFKGKWEQKFDTRETADDKFYVNEKNVITTSFMRLKGKFNMVLNGQLNSKVLELPYIGDRLSMILILPEDKFGLSRVEDKLSIRTLRQIQSGFKNKETVILSIPKFQLEIGTELSEILQSLGVQDLFGAKANLKGISPGGDLWVSSIAHKALVEVNEEGTEAAAATAVNIETRMFVKHPRFTADHPFIFFIYDKITDTILFIGRLNEPPNFPTSRTEL